MRLGFGWRIQSQDECVDCYATRGWLLTRGHEWEQDQWRLGWLRRLHPARTWRWTRWGPTLTALFKALYNRRLTLFEQVFRDYLQNAIAASLAIFEHDQPTQMVLLDDAPLLHNGDTIEVTWSTLPPLERQDDATDR